MEDHWTIGQMCERFDLTARTLRFYEDRGLLTPLREGQKRLYSKRDRARLKLVLQGKRFGFSLDEIASLLSLYDLGDQQETQLRQTIDAANRHLSNLQSQRDELDSAITDLGTHIRHMQDMLTNRTNPRNAASQHRDPAK